MGRTVDFVVIFDAGVKKRHYHETEKGKVKYFAVQRVAVRYDCSHGFSHVDRYDMKAARVRKC